MQRQTRTPSQNQASPSKPDAGVGTCCLYFAAAAPPAPDNILYLNGDGSGIVNNACFPSTVSASYAPPGQVCGLFVCIYENMSMLCVSVC